MWPIAIRTLISDRAKLFAALVGVVFSVVLVNVQGGLFLGLMQKAGTLVDHGKADIWVGHRKMHNVDFPHDIPRRWIYRIRGLPGVARAEPYLVGPSKLTLPSGGYEDVFVVGVDEASMLGNAWNMKHGTPADVLKTDGVITDELEDPKLDNPAIGDVREIGGVRARVVAKSYGVMGFLVNPYVFTSYARAARFLRKPPDLCSYFLVQVKPGVDPEGICAAIRNRIPQVEAYTRTKYSAISVNYWMTRTGVGLSFGAATLIGVLVGLVMVAQALYAMVLDRLIEFGTLKAIGASERQLLAIVLWHAVMMAVAGSLIGIGIVGVVQYQFTSPKAPILVPLWLSVGSCALVTAICLMSAILPYVRIRKVDPLTVLQT